MKLQRSTSAIQVYTIVDDGSTKKETKNGNCCRPVSPNNQPDFISRNSFWYTVAEKKEEKREEVIREESSAEAPLLKK